MSQSFLNTGTLVILCTRVLLLCVVVCKRGWEVSLTRVQIPADAVLCYRFWRQSLIMSSSPSQGQKRRCAVVSIAAFKAGNPGSIPGQHSFVLQVLKTECYDEFESHSVSEERWYSGEQSCLQSRYRGFHSRPMQFCVTGSEDRVLSWVPVLLLTLWLFATSSI